MAHTFRNTHKNGYCFVRFHHDLISYDTIFHIEKNTKQSAKHNQHSIFTFSGFSIFSVVITIAGSSSMTSRTHAYRQSHSGVFPMDRCLYGRNPEAIRHTGISFLSTSFTVLQSQPGIYPTDPGT